jgi:hypothetical protein
LVLGDNANIENNSGVIMRELESVVPASATTLVLPIYRYPAQLGDQVALAEEIRGDLGAYPVPIQGRARALTGRGEIEGPSGGEV